MKSRAERKLKIAVVNLVVVAVLACWAWNHMGHWYPAIWFNGLVAGATVSAAVAYLVVVLSERKVDQVLDESRRLNEQSKQLLNEYIRKTL